jgi:hypothetical protein
MLNTWLTIIGAAGVIGSLVFAGMQTRELTKQTRLNTNISVTSFNFAFAEHLNSVDRLILANPELEPYVFGGRECLVDDPARPRVEALARMMADSLEHGLEISDSVFGERTDGVWKRSSFSFHMHDQFPYLRRLVTDHPDWWPTLSAHWARGPIDGPPAE